MGWKRKFCSFCLGVVLFFFCVLPARAEVSISSPSVILMESSTGKVIYERNASDRRSPASITKIMTLLVTFEAIETGKVSLEDEVMVSTHASSMGGSQVYLAEGEIQTLDTMVKCIAVASGNDASVAVAEHVAGSEEAFVKLMNEKAKELGLADTHFEDASGLSNSDNHYTSARDVAVMSRELLLHYPEVLNYTTIWMEDITHVTKQGSSIFTLSSTNKLLKQYQYATGLKTGSTDKAKYCISATASKDGIDLIAVVLGAADPKTRFGEARLLLNYGFGVCRLYIDENKDPLPSVPIQGAVVKEVALKYPGEFRYLDTAGNSLEQVEKVLDLPETVQAPVEAGADAGVVRWLLDGTEIGRLSLIYAESVKKATYKDYLKEIWERYLL